MLIGIGSGDGANVVLFRYMEEKRDLLGLHQDNDQSILYFVY